MVVGGRSCKVFKTIRVSSTSTLKKIGISGKTCAPFFKWMGTNYQMRTIDLSHNNLGDGVAQELISIVSTANGLTTLKLTKIKISPKTLENLCDALKENKSIRVFDVSLNAFDKKKGGDSLVEALKKNTTLRNIGIGGMQMGKQALCNIATFIKTTKTIKSIDFKETAEFKLPECIQAWKDILSSKDCSLEEISFAKCALSPEALKEICAVLTTNVQLKKIDFSENKLGRPGLLSLAEVLQKNQTLRIITLRASDINVALLSDFLKALDNKNITLKRIEIGDNGKSTLAEWRSVLSKSNSHIQCYL
jgi:Ran GTPase-activating protein (RanGAP) involved in mRNA processing and transport